MSGQVSGQWYLGFGASEALFGLNEAYRASLNSEPEKVQAQRLYDLLSTFADECLDQYFLSPMESIQLNGVGKKVVTGGVSAIKGTIHLTLKQVTKKLSAEDRQQLADYINSLMLQLRETKRFPTFVAVPISHDLRRRLGEPAEKGRADPSAVVDAYSAALCELIEVAIDAYINTPIRMLKMGVVLNKIATLASDSIRGAAQMVVRKVLHSMSDREILHFFDFSESILYPEPQALAA